ncbi:MAG: UvrD-helicase domain-containing protein [Gammaproteobacteria bacterium]
MIDAVTADDAQRRQAIDPADSFIVQAPAGSGKTELLIQRYLRLLAVVDEPEEIIAITFTRKAAAEMRARVLNALRGIDSGAEPKTRHEARTRELAQAARARDQAQAWALKDHPARLRIQTIDALCARLAGQMPLGARFVAHLEPVDDADDLYRAAARSLLAGLETESAQARATEALLRHLDNNITLFEDLLVPMLARRDHWLRHVVSHTTDEDARRQSLEAGFANVIRDALADVCEAVPASLQPALIELACYAAGNLRRQQTPSAIAACAGLEDVPGAPDLQAWTGIAELLLTRGGHWRKVCGRRIGFPASGANRAETAEYKRRKQLFTELIDACRDNDRLRDRLHALRRLPAERYSDPQWAIMQALFGLLPAAAAHLDLIFLERNQIDFTGVAQRAADALGTPEQPTDLALKLDYQIRHILIDEFQDTSLSQSKLLEKLTAGWQPGDGRTLFAVGDPMQSIYGFREAEVGVFLRVRHGGIGQVRLTPLTLSANFRSQQGVVQWINASFPEVFPKVEDPAAGAVTYTSCDAVHPRLEGDAVTTHCFVENDAGAEAQRVVELIGRARDERPDDTIAILVRGKSHLAAIVPRLNAARVRFRAVEIDRLGDRAVVQDLLALTRALSHPADRVAWLSVLRAPWCGLSLQDLYRLAGDDRRAALWVLINDDARLLALSPDGRRRLSRLRAVLSPTIAQRRRSTLRRRIEAAWLALGGPATVNHEAELENARMFFELLDALDDGGDVTDFAALAARVDRLFAAPDAHADERLQIMTIHKAKGLQFDTVIVPGLGRRMRSDGKQLLKWYERFNRSGNTDLLIAPISATAQRETDASYTAIQKLIDAKDRHEDERLLYVAATRARRRLHLLGHARLNKAGECQAAPRTLLAALWPVVAQNFTEAAAHPGRTGASERAENAARPAIRRLSSTWRTPPPPAGIEVAVAPDQAPANAASYDVEFMWAGQTARHVGVVVHRLLQRIAAEGLSAWHAARVRTQKPAHRAMLATLGVPQDALTEAVKRVEQAVLNAIGSERGRWLLDASHAHAREEYGLTGHVDGRLVNIKIDRTFVDINGVRWIVDYKTGTHEGADIEKFLREEEQRYRPQLARYAALMRLFESRPIRAGLFYPLIIQSATDGWREWSVE